MSVQSQLLTAANYAILAAAGITNTGATVITGGNIGSFPTTSITGITGANFTAPAAVDNVNAAQAQTDGHAAYLYYKALGAAGITIGTGDIGVSGAQGSAGAPIGTWYAGAYVSGSSIAITSAVTLDGQGNPNALFIFYSTASTITQALAGTITLINGAQPNNVIWVVGSSWTTTTGAGSILVGNVLADTSISVGGGLITGRLLAGLFTSSGAVTLASATTINAPAFGPAPPSGSPSNNCLISRNLGSSVLTAWPQVTGQNGTKQFLDLIQIVDYGGVVLLNVDNAGVVHYPAVAPTNGVRLGQYFTRLNSTATLAALSLDTWTNNPAQEDIIQVINIGGNISYWLDYVLVAHGS
jgi:hypothetical protein